MNMMILVSIGILAIVLIIAYKGLFHKQQSDSVLRQRAVFTTYEHTTFTRLKEVMPEANILAHVSFDALMTTKFPHTRRKYEKMFADFVVMDKECRVIAIVAIGELMSLKKLQTANYQDSLLESAGYKVLRYTEVPEYQELRDDFKVQNTIKQPLHQLQGRGLGKLEITRLDQSDLRRVKLIYV